MSLSPCTFLFLEDAIQMVCKDVIHPYISQASQLPSMCEPGDIREAKMFGVRAESAQQYVRSL